MKKEYTIRDRIVSLEIDESVVAVRYAEPAPHSTRARVAREARLGPFEDRIEVVEEHYTIIPVAEFDDDASARFARATRSLSESPDVRRVAPVFKSGDRRTIATDRLSVRLRGGSLEASGILDKYDLVLLEEYGEQEYLLQLSAADDPFDLCEKISSEPSVDYAEPDFVVLGKHIARRAVQSQQPRGRMRTNALFDDPRSNEQYAIFITEAISAWDEQTGNPNITIAILDEGVDTQHPDLKSAITGSYDGVDNDIWQEPNPWDAHGTACAGLAAAVHNNKEGIKGIGGGCSIFAVRIAFSHSDGANWTTRNSWIRRAIDWSWKEGADVLSNSWGGGVYSAAIHDAFERARMQGRNNQGCVIVVAAGNDSGPVDFPGNLPNIVTVSATNEFDEFKTKTSLDGEHWWGSNFGPEVDVAAPGVHNLTTDIQGPDGYDPSDYTDFNGTSSSTPIVAGACGLLLSAFPSLGERQVRDALRASADKVGSTPYVGGRNDEMGYGRVNVRKLLDYVSAVHTGV